MRSTISNKLVHVSTESASGGRSPQMSYLSSTRSYRVSLGHIKIFCCILVSVVMGSALGAVPFANVERQRFNDVPAKRTQLTGREKSINEFQIFPVSFALVCNLLPEHTKSDILNCASKTVIGSHASNIQILDADYVEMSNQIGSEFMQCIRSTIADVFMQSSNSDALSLPSTTTFFASSENSLQSSQLREITPKITRICNAFTTGKCCHSADTQINTDSLSGLRQFLNQLIKAESNKVFTRRFLGYRNRGRFTFETSAPVNIETAQAGKNEIFIDNTPLKSTDGILSGLFVSFLFERRIATSFGPEIQKCYLQMPKSLLSRNTRNISQPLSFFLLFQGSQQSGCIKVTDSFLLCSPCIGADIQSPIIDISATAKDLRKFYGLFSCWVKSEPVSCFHINIIYYVRIEVNNHFQKDAAVPPRRLKPCGFPAV